MKNSDLTVEVRAFEGSMTKAEVLQRVAEHKAADRIIQGHYWEEGGDGVFRGCAVGCLTHSIDSTTEEGAGRHDLFPELFGLPEWFAHLVDAIHEGLPAGMAVDWPGRLMAAIPESVAIDEAFADRLSIRRLEEIVLPLRGSWPDSVRGQVVEAIEDVVLALKGPSADRRAAARAAAGAAAWDAARDAAGSAARDAARAAAWDAAWDAAGSAARAAAGAAARSAAWIAQADQLMEELERLAP